MRLAIVLALCAVGLTSAQTPVRDPAQGQVPMGTGGISGIVSDERNELLRRATVTITGVGLTLSTVTDDGGRFNFVALPTGRFTLTASKAAYPATSYGAKRPNRPGSGILVGEGQQVTNVKLMLAKGGVLAGAVYDERGQPMPGVPVMAWEVRASLAGDRILDMPATGGVAVTSDDRGAYRVYGLPPGEYTIGTSWFYRGSSVRIPSDAEIRAAFLAASQAAPPQPVSAGAASRPSPRTGSYSPVFMPDSVDPMRAATVQLAAGEEKLGLDLHMQFASMSKIEGVIVDDTGPVEGAELQIARRSTTAALNSTSVYPFLPNGRFSSDGLGPGNYSLTAQLRANGDRPAQWAMAEVTVTGAESIPVTLRLQPGMTVNGRVISSAREGAPVFDASKVFVYLNSISGPSGQGGGNGTVKVDANGVLTIAGVMPARVRVSTSIPGAGPQQWMLQSVMAGDRDVTDQPFDIEAGAPPTLTVTFTDQISELSGALTDAAGKPAPDYFVIVVPADRKYWTPSRRIASTRPDVQGRFVFRALPPGDYRVGVTTDLVQRDLQDVNALLQLMDQSAPVTVGLGEKKVFDIRLGDR